MPGAGDIGEGIEGAAGQGAAEARDLVEPGNEGVAAAAELGDHGVHAVPRPGRARRCPARCVKLAVQELEFTISLLTASTSHSGITPYPMRHPVIA